MKTVMLTVGRAKAPFAEAEAHYRKLLARHQPVDLVEAKTSADLIPRLPRGAWTAAIHEHGDEMDSAAWSGWLVEKRVGARDLWLVVGGPEGLPQEVLEAADQRISLGRQTMAHQLARVIVLEQLFRAAKIAAGERYHR